MGSRAEVMAALHDASARFIALAADVTPAEATQPVPSLEWSVADTIAHVLTVVRRGYADPRRSATAAETAALNQICLDEVDDRDPVTLTAALREDVHTALDLVYPKIPDDRVFPFHGGVTTTMTPALHVVLGEFVIHGYDIAGALGKEWEIGEHEAKLLVPGDLMGAWLRPGVPDERYELRIGGEEVIRFEITDGKLVVSPGDDSAPADVIVAEPVELVLTFYGRIPTSDPVLIRLLSRFVPT
jgi:uncharacterized protein (TIGR03083 family)